VLQLADEVWLVTILPMNDSDLYKFYLCKHGIEDSMYSRDGQRNRNYNGVANPHRVTVGCPLELFLPQSCSHGLP